MTPQIVEALKGGATQGAAAKQFGISPPVVARIAKQAGVPPQRGRRPRAAGPASLAAPKPVAARGGRGGWRKQRQQYLVVLKGEPKRVFADIELAKAFADGCNSAGLGALAQVLKLEQVV